MRDRFFIVIAGIAITSGLYFLIMFLYSHNVMNIFWCFVSIVLGAGIVFFTPEKRKHKSILNHW